jgi:hypothetical protein
MPYLGYDGPDIVSKAMLDKLAGLTVEYSQLQTKLAAADGNKEAVVIDWMETSDNPQAEKLRASIANATAKLRELAEKNAQFEELSEDDKDKLQVQLDEMKQPIKTGFEVVKNLIETLSDDPEGVQTALDTLDNPVKSNRGRKPGSAGSSLPRISANVVVTGGNLENEIYDSFSKVALALNAEVKDLQLAFAEAAGVKHEDIKSVNESVTFQFTPNHPNASTYTLVTTPKDRKKPGPRKAQENAESSQEEGSSEENAA